MPISGLVLTLVSEPNGRSSALAALHADPRITVGEQAGDRLALVTETPSLTESRDLAVALSEIEGVALLEVVTIDFSDVEEVGA